MKLFKICTFIILIVMLFPPLVFAEEWGNGGKSVDEMLNSEQLEQDDSKIDAEGNQREDSEQPAIESEEESDEELLPGSEDQSVFWLFFQMFIALGVILVLIYALLKLLNKRSKHFGRHSTLESVGGVSLGPSKSVQIVRVGDKLIIVGVGDSINLIKEITDPDEVKKILDEHKPQEALDQPVYKASQWMKERFFNKKSTTESRGSFQQLLSKELKDVKASQDKVHSVLKEKNDD